MHYEIDDLGFLPCNFLSFFLFFVQLTREDFLFLRFSYSCNSSTTTTTVSTLSPAPSGRPNHGCELFSSWGGPGPRPRRMMNRLRSGSCPTRPKPNWPHPIEAAFWARLSPSTPYCWLFRVYNKRMILIMTERRNYTVA